jgi:hypothetical protein
MRALMRGGPKCRTGAIDARLAICYERLSFAVWRMRFVRQVFVRQVFVQQVFARQVFAQRFVERCRRWQAW